jgi:hypothetical protein
VFGSSRRIRGVKTPREIAARLEPHEDATTLVTAVSEAVEHYDPLTEAVILLVTDKTFLVLILGREGGITSAGSTSRGLRRRSGERSEYASCSRSNTALTRLNGFVALTFRVLVRNHYGQILRVGPEF